MFLTSQDPPVITHRKGTIPGLLTVAEHAGYAIPQALDNLGCGDDFARAHFGCDIGVAAVMKALNDLGAETYESNYSRAVLDPNRLSEEETSIPPLRDGVPILANMNLTPRQRQERTDIFFNGYHSPLDNLFERRLKEHPDLFYMSVHSMAKSLDVDSLGNKTGGKIRPEIALLYRDKENDLAEEFAAFYREQGIRDIGMNTPYSAKDDGHRVPMFVKYQPRVPLILIEFRNDLISSPEGAAHHAGLLLKAIQAVALKS